MRILSSKVMSLNLIVLILISCHIEIKSQKHDIEEEPYLPSMMSQLQEVDSKDHDFPDTENTRISTTSVPLLDDSGVFRIPPNDSIILPKTLQISINNGDDCSRTCTSSNSPKTCRYRFVVENYMTMNDACGNCPQNPDDCSRAQCVTADGYETAIKTVNRQIPGPDIQVCKGDTVIVDLENRLMGEETTIHWHGLFQKGTPYMDGVPMVTQCPIISGNTFQYKFMADQVGTNFWHSHDGFHMLDGISGPLIVRDRKDRDPHRSLYNYDQPEHVIIIQDWIHESGASNFPGRKNRDPSQLPVTYLINGNGRHENSTTPLHVFNVNSGYNYRFRLINAGALACPIQLQIQGHKMRVIATDAQNIQPVLVDTLISFSGERYDFILQATQRVQSYWIHVKGLVACASRGINQAAILQYNKAALPPMDNIPTYQNEYPIGTLLNPLDGDCAATTRADAFCVSELRSLPSTNTPLAQQEVDVKLSVPFGFHRFDPTTLFQGNQFLPYNQAGRGAPSISMMGSGISFVAPPAPPLTQMCELPRSALCTQSRRPTECKDTEVCMCTHLEEIHLNSIVEVILIAEDQTVNLSHPFHLHGHAFEVLNQGRLLDRRISVQEVARLERLRSFRRRVEYPVLKDTIAIPSNGFAIIRFRADNPGFWIFHCHFAFHANTGMAMVFQINGQLPPKPANFPRCGNFALED